MNFQTTSANNYQQFAQFRFPININYHNHYIQTANSNKYVPNFKTGHWTEKQNVKYFSFLKTYHEKFSQKQSRRQWKVFKALSQFVKTRNANQCRSHHHKMQKNFDNIGKTLDYLRKKYPQIENKSQKYLQELKFLSSRLFPQGNDQELQKLNYLNNPDINNAFKFVGYNEDEKLVRVHQQGELEIKQAMRTADSYENQQLKKNYLKLQNFHLAARPSNDLFQSQALPFNWKFQNYDKNNEQRNMKLKTSENFAQLISYFERKSAYESKLLECHYFFQKWYTKMGELVQRSTSEQEQNTLDYKNNSFIFY